MELGEDKLVVENEMLWMTVESLSDIISMLTNILKDVPEMKNPLMRTKLNEFDIYLKHIEKKIAERLI